MKNTTMVIVLLLSVTISCNQKNSTNVEVDNEESVFVEVKRIKSQFEEGSTYRYIYKGNIKNVSSFVFDEVNTTVDVEFLLENDNVITSKDYQTMVFDGSGMDFKYSWKPNETLPVDDDENADLRKKYPLSFPNGDKGTGLTSGSIPLRYKDYPIKKVTAVLSFKTTDVINQTKETYQKTLDITKEWNELK